MQDVLVAVCGLTPQVVTETLWALHHCAPPVDPAELWILTTNAGRDVCRRKLFGPQGAIAAYLREHGRPRGSLSYGPDRLIVLKGADGAPLEDVRSEADNRAVADQIADFIRRQAGRPDVRLHCSVAGGRKTMGVLLAGALQLFGRAEDRLYHVLVPVEVERQPELFYPVRPDRELGRAGRTTATPVRPIELADIPYVRLRSLLPRETLSSDVRLTDLVARAERELRALTSPEFLRIGGIGTPRPRIMIGGTAVSMRPDAARLYTALARVKKDRCAKPELITCENCTACYVPISSQTWEETRPSIELLAGPGKLPASVEPVRSLISKANQALAKVLGSRRVAERYAIRSVGERHAKHYGLAVDKTTIQIES